MSQSLVGLFGEGQAQAQGATAAEQKADAQSTNTHITPNCEDAALNPDGSNSDFFQPCVARFKAFYLGDGSGAPDCPPDDGSTNYQYCFGAAKMGEQQAAKDFPDFAKICDVFISNAKGGSWPNFSNLNGSDKQQAIDACNKGVGAGYTYAPGYYTNEPCGTSYKNNDTLLKACQAGESLMDAHLFTLAEVKAAAKAGNLKMTDNSDNSDNGGGGAGAGGASDGVSCDLGISLSVGGVLNAINPLNWLLCGIVKGMDLIVTSLDDQINSMLVLGTGGNTSSDNPNNIFADSNGNCGAKNGVCDNYYTAWQSFRNIALGLLVIIGLIIVISQALGMEILDAYTIRKMLPRVLIATIAITLSWQIMRFAVTVSNDLGYGVGHLLDAPFHGMGQNIKVGGSNGLLATFALALGGIFFDLFGMLAFVGTAAIAVIVTFLVLTLRQIAVILLIIFSPVAIIAYVLPNTQRVYKFWWESFSKLLLMFPMIVAFITAGHIFSAISSDQGSGFIHQTIAFIAYFGPYFAIPLTFRFAGGLMSGIGNAVNGRAEGARGFLRNVRSNRAKYNTGRLKSGTRFESRIPGTRKLQGGLNEVTKGIGTGFKGKFGLGATGKEARARVTQGAGADLLNDPGMKAIRGKNDYNRVIAAGMGDKARGRQALIDHLTTGGDDGKTFMSEAQAAERADVAVKAANSAGAFTKAHGVAAFYNMARDGTAIRDVDDLGRLAARVGEGDGVNTYTYAAEAASISKGAGRHDLSASTESIGDVALHHADELYNGGKAKLYNPEAAGKKRLSQQQLTDDAKLSAFGNSQSYEWLTQGKGRALRNGHSFLAEIMSDKTGRFSAEQKQEAAGHMASALSGIKSGTGADNKRMEAYKAMQPALADYEEYMGTEVGGTVKERRGNQEIERPRTNRDVVAESGNIERQHGLSLEQMQEGMGGGGPQEEEEQ